MGVCWFVSAFCTLSTGWMQALHFAVCKAFSFTAKWGNILAYVQCIKDTFVQLLTILHKCVKRFAHISKENCKIVKLSRDDWTRLFSGRSFSGLKFNSQGKYYRWQWITQWCSVNDIFFLLLFPQHDTSVSSFLYGAEEGACHNCPAHCGYWKRHFGCRWVPRYECVVFCMDCNYMHILNDQQ